MRTCNRGGPGAAPNRGGRCGNGGPVYADIDRSGRIDIADVLALAREGVAQAALDFPHSPTHLRFVSFMTDGYIGNEADILAAVHRHIGNAASSASASAARSTAT